MPPPGGPQLRRDKMVAVEGPYVPRQYQFKPEMEPVYASDSADPALVLPRMQPYTLGQALMGPEEPELIPYMVTPRGAQLHLHVFRPAASSPCKEAAVVLHFHGGGWSGGEPQVFYPSCRFFAERGAVAISVQYRLYEPEEGTARYGAATVTGTDQQSEASAPSATGLTLVTPQDCVADCRAAMQYVRTHASELGIDPARICALGDSAGGHLSLMLGFPPSAIPQPGDDDRAVANLVVSYNPVADLETDNHGWTHVHGADRLDISPVHRFAALSSAPGSAAASPPPTLLIHGELDSVCHVDQSRRIAAIATSQSWSQGTFRYLELAATNHAFCYPNYTAPPSVVATALQATVLFLGHHGFLELSESERGCVATNIGPGPPPGPEGYRSSAVGGFSKL